jgi:hypothetical protein
MSNNAKGSRKEHNPPGPKPDTLKLKGNWERVVKRSLKKKKPSTGWPK